MTSIYQQALGPEFARLHPKIQARFGFSGADRVASIGRGVMHRIWTGPAVVKPFLLLGTLRHIMFPESGREIPFQIENYAFRDPQGREFVTWVRTFSFPGRQRRFDAYMTPGKAPGSITDFFGTHGHYGVDLALSVTERGGMAIRSTGHTMLLGGCALPFPEALAGRANVEEWYDDARQCFCIDVRVENPLIGPIFGYEGEFEAEWVAADRLPDHVLPLRLAARPVAVS